MDLQPSLGPGNERSEGADEWTDSADRSLRLWKQEIVESQASCPNPIRCSVTGIVSFASARRDKSSSRARYISHFACCPGNALHHIPVRVCLRPGAPRRRQTSEE